MPYIRPELPMTYIRTELRNIENKHASFVTIVYADPDGKEWYYGAAAFWYDLKPMKIEDHGPESLTHL